MRPQRRHVIGGVTATLISGGAAGLLLLAPSLANAADPVAEALTQQAPPTTEPADDGDIAADDGARGDRWRELLEPLVEEGTLTADQADAVVEELEATGHPAIWVEGPIDIHGGPGDMTFTDMGFPGGPGEPGGPGGIGGRHDGPEMSVTIGVPFGPSTADAVANTIGIDLSELITQVRDGSTVAEVATANGVDPQAVIDALVTDLSDRTAAAVDSGRLMQEEADAYLTDATERITAWVNGAAPETPESPDTEPTNDDTGTAPTESAVDVTETTTSA